MTAGRTERELHLLMDKLLEGMIEMKGDREETCPIGIISMNNWEWPQGVGLFAAYLYYRETRDAKLLSFLQGWYADRFREGLPSKNVNTMCPMLTLAFLYEETGEASYLPYLREWAAYALTDMPRTEEGALQHVVSGEENEGQIWDDTLYMTVLFMAKMGLIERDDRYVQESVRQFIVHLKYLTDPVSGLFFHGWTFKEKHHFAKALWARGNSWYTAGLVDYIEMVELPDGVLSALLSALERQAEALAELQAADGLWHTLLDDPASYTETSAAAAFGYGLLKAVRKGYLPGRYREVGMRALDAVIGRIDGNGIVQGVSYGTGMGRTLQEYRDIPVCPMPYGQSMAMLLLAEAVKHIRQ